MSSTNDQKPAVSFSQIEATSNQTIKQNSSHNAGQEKSSNSATGTNLGIKENSHNQNSNSLSQGNGFLHLFIYVLTMIAILWPMLGVRLNVSSLHGPTGASQAQDDAGDGKSNDLLVSCPAFRNELGVEPVRRIALSRHTCHQNTSGKSQVSPNKSAEERKFTTQIYIRNILKSYMFSMPCLKTFFFSSIYLERLVIS
uniref:Uncharacterized protein n=1 Tax=Meloidogyne incognita TaxID=6306 RepID=A0A914NG31_MELIC